MQYSKELDIVINNAMKDLIKEYLDGSLMFNKENNEKYLKLYLELKKESSF